MIGLTKNIYLSHIQKRKESVFRPYAPQFTHTHLGCFVMHFWYIRFLLVYIELEDQGLLLSATDPFFLCLSFSERPFVFVLLFTSIKGVIYRYGGDDFYFHIACCISEFIDEFLVILIIIR